MSWRDELTRRFPKLARLGPGSYVVGGAIRDLFAGREPADVDVASPDPFAAARTIRDRVIRLGGGEHLVAYRVVDGNHVYDFAEILGGDIQRDLARRDFTVNAMAVDLASGALLDPYGGREDVERAVVRMVQPSNFDDDPLRTLKAIRMAVRYDMTIEPATLEALRARASKITAIAAERVTYELEVIFSSRRFRKAVELLATTGLGPALGFRAIEAQAEDVGVAGAYALLLDDPATFAKRWKWSGQLLRDVQTLQRLIDHTDRIALYDAGESLARQLPAVLRALGRNDTLDFPDFSIRALLAGEEIATITGLAPGKELGRIKRELLEAQVRGEVQSREEAEDFVSRKG